MSKMSLAETEVIILCGGNGSRLKSIVSDRQKCAAPLAGKPFICRLIEWNAAFGINKFVLSAGHFSASVEEAVSTLPAGLDIHLSVEENPLGTGGAVKQALRATKGKSVMVLNGDSFCPVNLHELLNTHGRTERLATIVLSKSGNLADVGNVSTGDDGQILKFSEKNPAEGCFVNAGIYLFNRTIEAYFPDNAVFSLEYDVFPVAACKGLYAFFTDAPLLDIGTPERFKIAEGYFNEHENSRK